MLIESVKRTYFFITVNVYQPNREAPIKLIQTIRGLKLKITTAVMIFGF